MEDDGIINYNHNDVPHPQHHHHQNNIDDDDTINQMENGTIIQKHNYNGYVTMDFSVDFKYCKIGLCIFGFLIRCTLMILILVF